MRVHVQLQPQIGRCLISLESPLSRQCRCKVTLTPSTITVVWHTAGADEPESATVAVAPDRIDTAAPVQHQGYRGLITLRVALVRGGDGAAAAAVRAKLAPRAPRAHGGFGNQLPAELECRVCAGMLTAGVIRQAFPLPTEGWAELCGYISCSSDLSHLTNVEAKPGSCLIGDSYILFNEADLDPARLLISHRTPVETPSTTTTESPQPTSAATVADAPQKDVPCSHHHEHNGSPDTASRVLDPEPEPEAVACCRCHAPLGVLEPTAPGSMSMHYRLSPHALVARGGVMSGAAARGAAATTKSTQSVERAATSLQQAVQALLSASRERSSRKVVVSSNAEQYRSARAPLLIWILNEGVAVAAGATPATTPLAVHPAIKVLYTANHRKIAGAWSSDPALVELELEPELVAVLHLELAHSTATLPRALRTCKSAEITMLTGFLRR
jgi:hypothetical protein